MKTVTIILTLALAAPAVAQTTITPLGGGITTITTPGQPRITCTDLGNGIVRCR